MRLGLICDDEVVGKIVLLSYLPEKQRNEETKAIYILFKLTISIKRHSNTYI